MKTSIALSLVGALALGACASIIEGRTQNVQVNTNPALQADCIFKDKKGQEYRARVPGAVTVNRGDGPLLVQCYVQGGKGDSIVEETLEPWALGNVLLGGVIGIAVDGYTGAYQKYPDQVTITLLADGSAPAAQ
jgi:hypothetical protein